MTQDQSKSRNGRFRKKPVVIEATQWFKMGDHPAVCMVKDYLANGGRGEESPGIDTLEGKLRVSPGDWIIKGVKGEHYAIKPDIFEATYEPESAASETAALEALRELVACKDLKDSLDAAIPDKFTGHTVEHYERVAEYQRRKPLAWAAARKALGPSPQTGAPK